MVKFTYSEVYIAFIRACQTNNTRLISALLNQLNEFDIEDVEGLVNDVREEDVDEN